ncbi:MAG: SurA N-terminal domain-containing protein, partial [Persicimonas sp.]
MLEEVRRAARSGFSYILIAALIVIFAVFFGVPADSCNPGQTTRFHVANIDGESVYTDDVNLIYNRAFGTRQQQDDQEQLQQQQAQALKAYLMIELLANKARDAGLRVDDQEFRDYMEDPLRNPEFASAYGRDGTWDGAFYERYVKHLLHANLTDYEDFKRDEALARKYMNMLEMQIALLPHELESTAKLRNTEYELDFVEFDPEALSEQLELSDDDVESFIDEHQDQIEEYYEENRGEYTSPERMEVRRIYLERGEEGPEGESAQERLEAAQERIDDGEDFATVAGEINDALRDEEGLLPMTSVDNMNQDIVSALEDADEGDIEKVETENELMLVRLEEREEETETPIEEVEEEIARKLLAEQKAGELLEGLAETLRKRAAETGSLSEALEELQDDED